MLRGLVLVRARIIVLGVCSRDRCRFASGLNSVRIEAGGIVLIIICRCLIRSFLLLLGLLTLGRRWC